MSRWTPRLVAPVVALVCLPIAAAAQNVAGTPSYGTVNLTSGFTPDPRVHSVRAGGNDYTTLAGCNAYIHAAAPDLRVHYSAGSFPLTFSTQSGTDVTLLINAPDGSWYCDDDSGDGNNAAMTFTSPMSGQYDIWVGTYRAQSGTLPEAQIHITELAGVSTGMLDWSLSPNYGSISLRAGFNPDPYMRSVNAGGSVAVSSMGAGCTGYATAAPDFNVNYTAGGFQLNVYAKSDSDVTLIVNAPDGSWYCSDDAFSTHPHVNFSNPMTGQYNIWIGTFYSDGTRPESVLYISEADPLW